VSVRGPARVRDTGTLIEVRELERLAAVLMLLRLIRRFRHSPIRRSRSTNGDQQLR
jgi:hypothetical protein